jgi:hypothetical protein
VQGSKWAVLLVLLIGCDQPDVYIEDEFPDIVVEHVYHTTYVEDTTPDVCILEDNTPDVIYVTEEDTTPDIVQEFYGDTADLPVLLWTEIGEPPMPKRFDELPVATAVNDADLFAISQSGTSKQVRADIAIPLPLNYIAGLITSNNGSDADHDIDVAPGVARDSTDVDNMRLTSAITKQIDAAWTVGTNQGGLDTGSVAGDTLYAIWLIKRSDTGVVDVLFSTSFTSPTMPTNYDRKRLIGAIRTDTAVDIIAYTQSGDYFRYTGEIVSDVNDSTITHNTWETGTLSVPPGALAYIYASVANATSTLPSVSLGIRAKGAVDDVQPLVESYLALNYAVGTDVFRDACKAGTVLVDANRQMEYAMFDNTGAATIEVRTFGFMMLSRREP